MSKDFTAVAFEVATEQLRRKPLKSYTAEEWREMLRQLNVGEAALIRDVYMSAVKAEEILAG